MQKKPWSLILALCVFLLAAVNVIILENCPNFFYGGGAVDTGPGEPESEADCEAISFGELLQESTLIVKGRYDGPQETSTHTDHLFTVFQVLRGEYAGSEISLCEYPQKEFGHSSYEIGVEYLLVLANPVPVYREHDRYSPIADLCVPLYPGASLSVQGGRPLGKNEEEKEFMEDPIGFLKKISTPVEDPKAKFLGMPRVFSGPWEKVLPKCNHVLRVNICGLVYKSEEQGIETFDCDVLETYKGNEFEGGITITFFEGMVAQGGEYVVLLERIGEENPPVYVLAAKEEGVFSAGSAEAQEIIQAIEAGNKA